MIERDLDLSTEMLAGGEKAPQDDVAKRTRDVTQPILLRACEPDNVAPAPATLRHARRAPKSEIRLNAHGHFEIYLGEPFEQVFGDQIAFPNRHLPADNFKGS